MKEYLEEYLMETYFKKWSPKERLDKKKKTKRAHKGTNFKLLKPKKGYKRIKLKGSNRYIRINLSATEKAQKKVLGKQLGKKTF